MEHIAARVPELVISDVQMPRMDGITFLQVVQERFPDVPVVLMTGAGDETDSGAAFEYGARGFLHKPIRLDAFLAGIRRIEKAL